MLYIPGKTSAFSGGGVPVTTSIGFVERQTDLAHASSADLTFTGADLGAADTNRQIVLAVSGFSPPGTTLPVVTGVTIAGVTATLIVGGYDDGAAEPFAEIWAASVPTGTSGNIVFSFNATVARLNCDIYRMIKSAGTTANDTASADGFGATLDLSVNTTVDGCAVYVTQNINGSDPTAPTGFTEASTGDVDLTGSNEWAGSGFITGIASAETPRTVTTDVSSGANSSAGVCASWT